MFICVSTLFVIHPPWEWERVIEFRIIIIIINTYVFFSLYFQVEENKSVAHAVGFLFFYPGLYKLNVQCIPKSQPEHTWKLIPPLEIHVT